MKLQFFFGVFIVILSMGPGLDAGEIYQWIDEDGVMHFTDGPPPPGAQMVEGLSETPPDEPAANPAQGGNANTVEDAPDAPAPSEAENAGGVEAGQAGPTDREEFWRRKGWDSGPVESEAPGAVEGGENPPAEPDGTSTPGEGEAGAVEEGEG